VLLNKAKLAIWIKC